MASNELNENKFLNFNVEIFHTMFFGFGNNVGYKLAIMGSTKNLYLLELEIT